MKRLLMIVLCWCGLTTPTEADDWDRYESGRAGYELANQTAVKLGLSTVPEEKVLEYCTKEVTCALGVLWELDKLPGVTATDLFQLEKALRRYYPIGQSYEDDE